MKTIILINLLCKIATGHNVPKKIKLYDELFEFDEDNSSYSNESNISLFQKIGIYKGRQILLTEVEVIEEQENNRIKK